MLQGQKGFVNLIKKTSFVKCSQNILAFVDTLCVVMYHELDIYVVMDVVY